MPIPDNPDVNVGADSDSSKVRSRNQDAACPHKWIIDQVSRPDLQISFLLGFPRTAVGRAYISNGKGAKLYPSCVAHDKGHFSVHAGGTDVGSAGQSIAADDLAIADCYFSPKVPVVWSLREDHATLTRINQ